MDPGLNLAQDYDIDHLKLEYNGSLGHCKARPCCHMWLILYNVWLNNYGYGTPIWKENSNKCVKMSKNTHVIKLGT